MSVYNPESGSDTCFSTGVFLVGNDVVMDNVVVGSLVGGGEEDAETEASTSTSLQKIAHLEIACTTFFFRRD